MNVYLVGFICFMIGGTCGLLCACLAQIASLQERYSEELSENENETKEEDFEY